MLRRASLIILVVLLSAFVGMYPIHAQQQTYTVQPGENLFRIALRYGLTAEALAAANGITDPTKIYAGQVLIIPAPSNSAATSQPTVEQPQDQAPVVVSPPESPG